MTLNTQTPTPPPVDPAVLGGVSPSAWDAVAGPHLSVNGTTAAGASRGPVTAAPGRPPPWSAHRSSQRALE